MFPPLLLDRSSVACEICFSSGKLFFFFFPSSSIQLYFFIFGYSRKCRAEIMQSEVNFPFYLMAIFLIFYTIFLYEVKLLPHCLFLFSFAFQRKWFLNILKCHLILNFFMLLCTFHGKVKRTSEVHCKE